MENEREKDWEEERETERQREITLPNVDLLCTDNSC